MLNVQGMGREQVFVTTVPDGDEGTRQAVFYARQLVLEGTAEPAVRALALKYLRRFNVASGDKLGELYAIFRGVLRDFRFRDDPAGTELLQPVLGILEKRVGDCDDLNLILLPALLGSIGFATRGVTVKADPERPSEYSHVYMEAQLPDGSWFPLDVARSNPEFGRSPERYWQRELWPMTTSSIGLNGYGLGAINPAMPFPGRTRVVRSLRKFPRRGLGQDGDTYDPSDIAMTFAQEAPAILQSTAQLVKATNTPGIAYSGVGLPGQQTGSTLGTGSSSSLLILLLLLGVGAFAMAK